MTPTFECGDRVQIDLPDHYTHERFGDVKRRGYTPGWVWVLLRGESELRSYPAWRLRSLGAGVNPTDFETRTGALR